MKHRFKEGDVVCHRDNLLQKMYVKGIVKKVKEIWKGEYNVDGSRRLVRIELMCGIDCHWWANGGILRKERFHSRELVPWEVVEKGEEAVRDWLLGQKGQGVLVVPSEGGEVAELGKVEVSVGEKEKVLSEMAEGVKESKESVVEGKKSVKRGKKLQV